MMGAELISIQTTLRCSQAYSSVRLNLLLQLIELSSQKWDQCDIVLTV